MIPTNIPPVRHNVPDADYEEKGGSDGGKVGKVDHLELRKKRIQEDESFVIMISKWASEQN